MSPAHGSPNGAAAVPRHEAVTLRRGAGLELRRGGMFRRFGGLPSSREEEAGVHASFRSDPESQKCFG